MPSSSHRLAKSFPGPKKEPDDGLKTKDSTGHHALIPASNTEQNLQKKRWTIGDYQSIAARFTIIGELLCEAVDLRAGERVLDIATGTGNTALAAARRRCYVTGVDFAPILLERARTRALAEGLESAFVEGKAESLPFPTGSFDIVMSTLGTMFVPDQQKVASELLRVCRSGGKIGLVSWTPDSWSAKVSGIMGNYLPPPPSSRSPFDWGCEQALPALLGTGARLIKLERRSFLARHKSVQAYWDFFLKASGIAAIRSTLSQSHAEDLDNEVLELTTRLNRSNDETLVLPQEYLEVVAVRQEPGKASMGL